MRRLNYNRKHRGTLPHDNLTPIRASPRAPPPNAPRPKILPSNEPQIRYLHHAKTLPHATLAAIVDRRNANAVRIAPQRCTRKRRSSP